MIAEYVPFLIAAILITAIVLELRTGRISNWLTILLMAVFAVMLAVAEDRTPLYWQLGLAALVFLAGLLMFAFAGLGAGAVKLMAGTALFIPIATAGYAFLVYAMTLVVSAFVIIQLRKAVGSDDSKWHVMANNILPMSIPISSAGLAALFWL